MTAPSIKQALELKSCPFCGGPAGCVAFEFVTCLSAQPLGEELCPGKQIKAPVDKEDPTYSTAWNTRATSQPSGERRIESLRVGDTYNSRLGPVVYLGLDHYQGETTHKFHVPGNPRPHYERASTLHSFLASGLVQDEAGWRDISTAPKDWIIGYTSWGQHVGKFHEHVGPCEYVSDHHEFANIDFDMFPAPTHWKPWPAPLRPIRSARTGGAES
jgi:hypothetical protein